MGSLLNYQTLAQNRNKYASYEYVHINTMHRRKCNGSTEPCFTGLGYIIDV